MVVTRRSSAIEVDSAVDVSADTVVAASAIATGNDQGSADADVMWQHRC